MKAVRIHRFGDPGELSYEEVATPVPAASEVLVRVAGAGVGNWDAIVREGKAYVALSLPLTLGAEFAGRVEAVGSAVTSFAPGDEVFGSTTNFIGSYAQWAALPAQMCAAKPRSLNLLDAAGVPVVAVTAWQMLFDKAEVTRGQIVFVHGAAGSVGSCAVQLAHAAEARVIAACAAPDIAYVRSLGADEVVDYAKPFEDAVHDIDVVIDTIGGEIQARSFAVTARGGVLVSSVSQPDAALAERYGVRAKYFIVDVTTERLRTIAAKIDAGELRVEIGTVLPLADAKVAHEMLAHTVPHARGKIVLSTE
jgi:NADPH:quinone reductase-like Zn-dependent oxidoreductase